MDKKNFSTFSHKLVQISPIMIVVNSGAFWFSRVHRTNFCHDTIHFFYWLPPNNARDYGSCASSELLVFTVTSPKIKIDKNCNYSVKSTLESGI